MFQAGREGNHERLSMPDAEMQIFNHRSLAPGFRNDLRFW
jgi:hypothetical protein